MKLPDRLRKMDDIFTPLKKCKGKPVAITTWGIGTMGDPSMLLLVDRLCTAHLVRLLVGYSKQTHDPEYLLSVARVMNGMKTDRGGKWEVRFLPSFHTKLWIIGRSAYGGSCNLAPNTCINRMWKVPIGDAWNHFELYWKQAAQVSKTTNLLLVPQARIHA